MFVYQNRTTTLIDLFEDRDCTVEETNPVIADSAGTLNLPYTRYTGLVTLVLKTAADVIVWSEDDVGLRPETTGSDVALAFKNALVNGGFSNWTSATSFSNISGSGAAVEVADDWYFAQASTASNTVSRQASANVANRYGLRMGRPAASVQTGKLRLFQALTTDEAYRMRGKTVTVSFSLQAGADFSGSTISILIASGTTEGEAGSGMDSGAWGGQINALSETQAPPTSPQRYEFTVALSSALKEAGLQLSYTPTGTAGSNDWIQIEDVLWEVADTATDFPALPEPIEYLRGNLGSFGRKVMALSAAGILKGLLFGATLSNNGSDATNDIDIAAGFCVDGTGASFATLAAMTKRLDAGWAAGTNQGMRNSAAAITDTTYLLFAVWKADGTQDYYAYAGGIAPSDATVLAALQAETGGSAYIYIRYIGAILRESGVIVPFVQDGDLFMRQTAAADISATNPGTSAVSRTLSVPRGKRVRALVQARLSTTTTSTSFAALLTDLSRADVAASLSNAQCTIRSLGTAGTYEGKGPAEVMTDTAATIRSRLLASDANTVLVISTDGWVDTRGRFA